MTKFYVTLNLKVEADNVDEARTMSHDMYNYGATGAEDNSEFGFIVGCKVEVDEV